MAKEITSNDWHLRGVSVEVRKLVDAYCDMTGQQQGDAVEELLRQSPALVAMAALVKSQKLQK